MADVLHPWIVSIICTAVLCAVAISLTPKGRVLSALKLVCGLVMVFAIVSPLKQLDFSEYSKYMAKYEDRAAELSSSGNEYGDKMNRTIIEDKCAAYILDKAESYGAELSSVSVAAEWSMDGYWYPISCNIAYSCSDDLKESISSSVEAELGIAKERQTWTYG